MAPGMGESTPIVQPGLNGQLIINELIRNMELGQFEMAYSILFPRIFTVYLNAENYAHLKGVFEMLGEDAKRSLRDHVARLNAAPKILGIKRPAKPRKEYRIAGSDWEIYFLEDPEGSVAAGGGEAP